MSSNLVAARGETSGVTVSREVALRSTDTFVNRMEILFGRRLSAPRRVLVVPTERRQTCSFLSEHRGMAEVLCSRGSYNIALDRDSLSDTSSWR